MKARTIFGTLCMMVFATCLVAQTTTLQANIPFQFHVGDNVLPAGHYTIVQVSDRATVLKLDDSSFSKAFITHPAERDAKSARPVMVFRQVGGVMFLSQIWKDYGSYGGELSKPKAARVQIARESEPNSETIIAMVRK